MSSSLSLLKFIPDSKGAICEDKHELIETFYIDSEILSFLLKKFTVLEESISEEYGSQEKSLFEFFDNKDIDEILSELEIYFLRELKESLYFLGLCDDKENNSFESWGQVFHCANNFSYHYKRQLLCTMKDLTLIFI